MFGRDEVVRLLDHIVTECGRERYRRKSMKFCRWNRRTHLEQGTVQGTKPVKIRDTVWLGIEAIEAHPRSREKPHPMDARRIYVNGKAIFGGTEGDGGPGQP